MIKLPAPVKSLESALLMLRRHGIRCTTLTVAGVTLDGIVDTKIVAAPGEKLEPPKTMWDERVDQLLNKPETPIDSVPDEAKEE